MNAQAFSTSRDAPFPEGHESMTILTEDKSLFLAAIWSAVSPLEFFFFYKVWTHSHDVHGKLKVSRAYCYVEACVLKFNQDEYPNFIYTGISWLKTMSKKNNNGSIPESIEEETL